MHAIRIHCQAVHALIIRDLMARFGRRHLGFFWTVLEPMILTCGVLLVWSFIKEPIIHGVPIVAFALTGYMPLTMWRHMTNPATRVLRNNANLLYHQPISYVDILIARLTLEFLSTTVALTIIYFVVVSLGVIDPIENYPVALAAWLLTAWFFGGIGLMIAAWTEYSELAERFIQPAQYLALPISGMFYMVDWMPGFAQKLLLLNPTVHCFEMFRAGFLGESVNAHYDPWYLVISASVTTILGCAAVYHVRDRINFA